MAVHHYDHNIVYTGLRNSRIHAEDLRIRGGRTSAAIAKLQRGKAVIGIKRLKDSAVPYGLVASGMSNEVSPLHHPLKSNYFPLWCDDDEMLTIPTSCCYLMFDMAINLCFHYQDTTMPICPTL